MHVKLYDYIFYRLGAFDLAILAKNAIFQQKNGRQSAILNPIGVIFSVHMCPM
jgi:hypothetical protein